MTNTHESLFETLYQQNKNRIHYQMRRLQIHDPHGEFHQEGLCALWSAHEKYQPDVGPMVTYFNFVIRHRLIDEIRKESKYQQHMQIHLEQTSGTQQVTSKPTASPTATYSTANHSNLDKHHFWSELQSKLTEKQWKWVHYGVIGGMSLKDIAIQENTTHEAVKSWAKQARKKLRNDYFKLDLQKAMEN